LITTIRRSHASRWNLEGETPRRSHGTRRDSHPGLGTMIVGIRVLVGIMGLGALRASLMELELTALPAANSYATAPEKDLAIVPDYGFIIERSSETHRTEKLMHPRRVPPSSLLSQSHSIHHYAPGVPRCSDFLRCSELAGNRSDDIQSLL
jgi:hypothetical protein